VLKEELFQRTGTFKPRGALTVMLDLAPEALARGGHGGERGQSRDRGGLRGPGAGQHGQGRDAEDREPYRVAKCRELDATVELVEDVHVAFDRVKQIEADEGRTFVHPFEGPRTALGTATVGLELVEQVPDVQAVVVPIGGGGLCAGVAAAVKLARPDCAVYGGRAGGRGQHEPQLRRGHSPGHTGVRTIADSLGAPHAAPYSFRPVPAATSDELVLVSDDALRPRWRCS
jgi:threonine dehydratase